MISLIDALDGIVGIEPEPEVQPVAFQAEPEVQPNQVTGQGLEQTESVKMPQPEPQSNPQPEAFDAITIPEPEIQSEPETQTAPESAATPAGAIRVPDTAPEPEQIAEPTETDSGPNSEPQSAVALDEDTTTENELTTEISELWSQHLELSGTRRATGKEIRILRAKLAERLFAMKQVLCRAGRAGQWRSWLKQQRIPRSSADRLCERHAETLGIKNQDAPGEATKQEETFDRLVQSLRPRLKRTLRDTQTVFRFIAAVGDSFGLTSEIAEECITVSQPKPGQNEPAALVNDAPDSETTEAAFPDADAPSLEPVSTVAAQV